jgi:hypothetical protein
VVGYLRDKISGLDDDEDGKRRQGIEDLLESVLDEGVKFYQHLCHQLRKKGRRAFAGHCLVRKGDLLRYHGSILNGLHISWREECRRAYLEGIKANPDDGQAYNQLGIVAEDNLEKMFQFCRASCAAIKFPDAEKNFEAIFKKCDALLHEEGSKVQCARRICIIGHLYGRKRCDLDAVIGHLNGLLLLEAEKVHLPSLLVSLEVLRQASDNEGRLSSLIRGLNFDDLAEVLNQLRDDRKEPIVEILTPLEEIEMARSCGMTFIDSAHASAGDCVLNNIRVRRIIRGAQQLVAKIKCPMSFSPAEGIFVISEPTPQSSLLMLSSSASWFRQAAPMSDYQ